MDMFVDLRLPPYSIVADSPVAAAANSLGVNRALDDFAIVPAGFVFPAGTIYCDQVAAKKASILLNGTVHTAAKSFRGQGRDVTVLQFQGAGDGGDWVGIKVTNGFRGFTCSEMTLRFGTVTAPDPGKQMHLLQVTNTVSSTRSTRDVEVYNMGFGPCIGAGFRTLGEGGANLQVENVSLHHCVFRTQGIGNGSRSCVEIQRGFSGIEISYCSMQGAKNTVIDCEETTSATEDGLFIHHNYLDHSLGQTHFAVSLGGSGAASLASRCRFADNYVTGGSVSCLSGDKWEISRNFIRVLATNAGGSNWAGVPILLLFQTNTDHIIEGNTVERGGAIGSGNVVYFECGPTVSQSYITLANNLLIQAVGGNMIQLESVDHVNIVGNTMRNTSATADFVGINVRALAHSCAKLQVIGNVLESTVVKMAAFIGISAGGSASGVMTTSDTTIASNNAGDAVLIGVLFDVPASDGSAVDQYPIVQANNFRGATTVWGASNHAAGKVFPIVAGNRGDICHLVGTVAPASVVAAVQGCRYTRQDGDSTQEFFKSTGVGNTGWSAAVVVP
jgi:hypothetical protein